MVTLGRNIQGAQPPLVSITCPHIFCFLHPAAVDYTLPGHHLREERT